MDFTYSGIIAVDESDQIAPDLAGQVYARTDEQRTTPLTVRLDSGDLVTTIRSGPRGLLETFTIADHAQVWWVGAGVAVLLTSYDGLVQTAETAAAAAQGARGDVAAARTDVAALRDQVTGYLGRNPAGGRGVVVLGPLDPAPDPDLLDDGVLVVRLNPFAEA